MSIQELVEKVKGEWEGIFIEGSQAEFLEGSDR